jgi:hypothetical protein
MMFILFWVLFKVIISVVDFYNVQCGNILQVTRCA